MRYGYALVPSVETGMHRRLVRIEILDWEQTTLQDRSVRALREDVH